jgi:hypothetical protein
MKKKKAGSLNQSNQLLLITMAKNVLSALLDVSDKTCGSFQQLLAASG